MALPFHDLFFEMLLLLSVENTFPPPLLVFNFLPCNDPIFSELFVLDTTSVIITVFSFFYPEIPPNMLCFASI